MNDHIQPTEAVPSGRPTQPASPDCPHCAAAQQQGAKFCPECGARLQPAVARTTTHEPCDAATPPLSPEAHVVNQRQCNDERNRKLDPAVPPSPALPPHCGCGRTLPEDAAYCSACGKPVNETSAARFRLTLMQGDDAGSSTPFDREVFVIGKDEGCNLVLTGDAYVSRRHARLRLEDDLVFLDDLGSSNGTLLRIRRPIALEVGDEILVGTTVIRLEQQTR